MRQLSLLSAFIFLALLSIESRAADIPPPPTLGVKSYLLLDFNSGNVIVEQAANNRIDPASLTKLMTAYLVFKALKDGSLQLGQVLPVSTKALKGGGTGCGGSLGSCMFLNPRQPVTVDELLHGMIVVSGNDASIALAEGIAGSEEAFADLMNSEAQRLSMKNTHFVNATGLSDPQHYTTASDLSLLAIALIRDFPDQYKRFYSVKEYTYNKINQLNRNRLLWLDPYVDGMKTGHTKNAGYCLISSAKRGGTRLVSVILGAPSDSVRAAESQRLLNYGFQFYESHLVYKRGQTVSALNVWKGVDNTVPATVADDLYLTLPKGEYAQVKAKMSSKQPLIAPVDAGQEVGTIQFFLGDKMIDQRSLVAANKVEIAGILGRMWDGIKLLFE